MKVARIKLPEAALEFLDSQGFAELYPPQADSIKAGLLDGKSVLVSAPTASGKTLIATLAILKYLSGNAGKVVYLSPLRALASEKFAEFKKMEGVALDNKIRVAISTGDFEGVERGLERSNVLVMTNEKMDSIIRRGADWIDEIGLVIADEVHLIGDQDRGPTLEMVLVRLKRLEACPQIVGLSATVTNADEIAGWLDCNLVNSGWRPVPLYEGVCDAGTVTMSGMKDFEVEPSRMGLAVDLGVQSVREGGQALIFAETRVRSAATATKACKAVAGLLTKAEGKRLEKASKEILKKNENTDLVRRLADLVRQGVAFHHAGLSQSCRDTVESEFRGGSIKLISSTPTLAAGVNLPARRVVISSISRYDARTGTNKAISVLEYKQLCGRAGRPQYDDHGEAIIVAGSYPAYELTEWYIESTPEPIESAIADERAMRIHVLSVIVTDPGLKQKDIVSFFLQTLGGCQSTKAGLKYQIGLALRFLTTEGLLVKKADRYAATDFGKKTSRLYIDPKTATALRDAIQGASPRGGHALGFLHVISGCEEFFPRLGLRNSDYETASRVIGDSSSELLKPISEYDCNRSLLALHMWISETTEIGLSEILGVESGDMHRMVETCDWLLYCMREICKQVDRADLLEEFDVLRSRVAYGIRGELTDLVRIKGVGRVRARVMYGHGIRSRDDLAKTPVGHLARIDKIGAALARKIKSQVRGGGS